MITTGKENRRFTKAVIEFHKCKKMAVALELIHAEGFLNVD